MAEAFISSDVRQLVKDLKGLEDGKALTAALRKNLKAAAEPIARQAKSNASWSSRIPAAIAIGTAFTAKRTGVFVKANAAKAPHARSYEDINNAGTFRHPVFGGETWVEQQSRPFLFNEAESHLPAVEEAAARAVEEAARSAGFS
jgi:hypothetical protein